MVFRKVLGMGRLVEEFLKARKGKSVFCAFVPTPGGNKAGCEGMLEDYDEEHVYLKGEDGVMLIARKGIISYECSYKNMKLIEIVPPINNQ
jgi:hypothetical protein